MHERERERERAREREIKRERAEGEIDSSKKTAILSTTISLYMYLQTEASLFVFKDGGQLRGSPILLLSFSLTHLLTHSLIHLLTHLLPFRFEASGHSINRLHQIKKGRETPSVECAFISSQHDSADIYSLIHV